MITCEQLADLQPGDVVELTHASHEGVTLRGPVRTHPDARVIWVGDALLMNVLEELRGASDWTTLTVVSRAPRPLYVNHPRTEPVPGDVVRDADDDDRSRVWIHLPHFKWSREPWVCQSGNEPIRRGRDILPARLRLLVDGETGQVVP